jgi:hypothetical protein
MPTRLLLAGWILSTVLNAHAVVHYVDAAATNSVPPYINWASAAAVIQDAVDVSNSGDEIVVNNGKYATGGRALSGILTNRVAIRNSIRLRSVNGPAYTVIQGYQAPGSTNGPVAVRCVYLSNGASLSGFTLTQGATGQYPDANYYDEQGGGVFCDSAAEVVSNCIIVSNCAGFYGGGASSGTLSHCTLSANVAFSGGGAYDSTLNNCRLVRNAAGVSDGGGAHFCTLNNCVLSFNSGGGAATYSTLNNCTVTGNSSDGSGGGANSSTLNNCIVYFNTAPQDSNYSGSTLSFCCTSPSAPGTGNITLDPKLASATYLSAGSPCRAAGSAAFAMGSDLDGESWSSPPSIGCDEFHVGTSTGLLTAAISALETNIAAGAQLALTGLIEGRALESHWEFGDGSGATNQPFTTHAWVAPGDYSVVLRAFNDDNPQGIAAALLVRVQSGTHYVFSGSTNPVSPYTSWATAATNIQDAVDAAAVGALVLVSNGIYASGGRAVYSTMTNRLTVDRPMTVRSVNGPQVTVIQGYQLPGTSIGTGAIRCAYLTNGVLLSGFTLEGGATLLPQWNSDTFHELSGGGVWCESRAALANCVITQNTAAQNGGGVLGGILTDCAIYGNQTSQSGYELEGGSAWGASLSRCTVTANLAGGAARCSLDNCVVADNVGYGAWASDVRNCTLTRNLGWGASESTVYNSIVYYNGGSAYGNAISSFVYYSCIAPIAGAQGSGNITNAPSLENLRLASNSPCINAGNNVYVTIDMDLDNNPRIVGGTVDIGAYEFQSPKSAISYAWLQQYGLPTDGSADLIDSDADGMNNWQEWRCGTDPTNALSALRLLSASRDGANLTVSWQSVAGISYIMERSTNIFPASGFTQIATIAGQPNTTDFTDTNALSLLPLFYRVGVTGP